MISGVYLFAAALGVAIALLLNNVQKAGDIDPTTLALHLLVDGTSKLIWMGDQYPRNESASAQFTRSLVAQASSVVASAASKSVLFEDVETDIYGPDYTGRRHFVRIFRPTQQQQVISPAPVLVYLFPGAWMIGSVAASHEQCAKLALRTGFLVMCPDYRQAPEFVYPTAFDDAAAAVQWAHRHAADFGGDSSRFFLIGESAGANLAAAVVARNLDEQYVLRNERIHFTAVALVYGAFAPRFDTASYRNNKHGILTAATMQWGWRMYSADRLEALVAASNYTFALLLTPEALLRQFPRTILSAGRFDVLFSDSDDLLLKLQQLDVPVESFFYDRLGHMYFGKSIFPNGDEALHQIADRLVSLASN